MLGPICGLQALALVACSSSAPAPADEPRAPAPAEASAAASVTDSSASRLTIAFGQEYPDFDYPLRVRVDGREILVEGPNAQSFRVAGHATDFTRVEVEGWRPIWLWLPAEGAARLTSHPCCGVEAVPIAPPDLEPSRCARNPSGDPCDPYAEGGDPACACPEGTSPVAPDSAVHQCSPGRRCSGPALVRLVADEPTVLEGEDGSLLTSEPPAVAQYRPLDPNIAHMWTGWVRAPDAPTPPRSERVDIALVPEARYTIHVSDFAIARIVRGDPPPADG